MLNKVRHHCDRIIVWSLQRTRDGLVDRGTASPNAARLILHEIKPVKRIVNFFSSDDSPPLTHLAFLTSHACNLNHVFPERAFP